MKAWRWLVRLFRSSLGLDRPAAGSQRAAAEDIWTRPVLSLREWSGEGSPPAMMWKPCHPRTREIFKAEMTCASGHAVSLKGHSVSADGAVWPSVVCLVPGCPFHDFVMLEGWNAGAV